MEPRLTICVTTYNRPEQLLLELRSLCQQGHWGEYRLRLNNNHSNYDVEAHLRQALPEGFLAAAEICNRPYNVGGNMNIAMCFREVHTDWMWLMGDDDVFLPGALETVLADIESHEQDCLVEYTVTEPHIVHMQQLPDRRGVGFSDFVGGLGTGLFALTFQSALLFNMQRLAPYTDWTLFECGPATYYPFLYLPFRALLNGECASTRSAQCVRMQRADGQWSLLQLSLAIPGFIYYTSLPWTPNDLNVFKRVFGGFLTPYTLRLREVKSRTLQWEYLKHWLAAFGLNRNWLIAFAIFLCPPLARLYDWHKARAKK